MNFEEITKSFLETNVNDYTEKKGGLTYLSWSYAWREVLKVDPNAEYSVKFFDRADGTKVPYIGNADMGYMVFTTMTIGGKTRECYLPVMDHQNRSILAPKSTDINKAIMRCMAKNAALFGLGLYIYAGEDLPEGEEATAPSPITAEQRAEMFELGVKIDNVIKRYGIASIDDLTAEQAQYVIDTKKEAVVAAQKRAE